MITDVEFRPGQLESLARCVGRVFEEDGVNMETICGLEVTALSDYGDGLYRMWYNAALTGAEGVRVEGTVIRKE